MSDAEVTELYAALGEAQPLYATRPNPDASHSLAKIETVSRLLGKPLLPWQRLVARTITEKNSDGSYRYPVVMLTVPRQSG